MNRLVAMRNFLLLALLVVTCCAMPVAGRLSFDQSIESFFAPGNPDIKLLQRSRREFGGDEFVIVAWRQPDLIVRDEDRGLPELSESAIDRIKFLANQLNTIPGVVPEQTRHLERYLQNAPKSRNTRAAMLKLFEGTLIGADESTTAIILQLRPETESSLPRAETIGRIRNVAGEFDATAAVAGEPVQIFDMFDLVERDGYVLYVFSLLVLSAVLLFLFRAVRWVIAAVGIVVSAVVVTRAALVLSGAQLSMVSSMLNSLVTVISVATTMHVIVHYREYRKTMDSRTATVTTLQQLWVPIFWALGTTAVGFGSLLVSEIVPVRSFSIMMMTGTGMVLLCTIAIVPSMLATGSTVQAPGRATLEDPLDRMLDRLAHVVEVHPIYSAVVCLVLVASTAPGLTQLRLETDFSRNFREASPIVQSLKFVETHLGGAGTWEVAFDVPDRLTSRFLDSTRELTDKLKSLNQGELELSVLSLNDAIDMPPRLGNAAARLNRIEKRQPDLVEGFYNPAAGRMRIVLRSREQQPAEVKLKLIQQVRQVVADHFATESDFAVVENSAAAADKTRESADSVAFALAQDAGGDVLQGPRATASGLYVLLAQIIDSLLSDQLNSFLVASGGILLCMTVAFRSLRIGLISLVPNIFPVVLVIGTLGMLDLPINIGTAMIASVSMGLTVDSTIHYITSFERARRLHSVGKALQIAHGGAGRALVLAYFALMLGFLVLTVSAFIPLVYFGALLSLSMIGGMVGDLVLLPLLLRWTTPLSEPSSID